MSNFRDDQHPDVRLVTAALAGDASAGETLIQRLECVPQMLHAKNAQIGAPFGWDELRDVVQDTLETIWRKLPSFEGRSTLETWVYAYCHNQLMNALRRKARRQAPFEDVDVERALDPRDESVERALEHDRLHQSLEALDSQQSRVIRLKHFEHLTFDQISARIGISANTAKTNYYRGLARLRQNLERSVREEYA